MTKHLYTSNVIIKYVIKKNDKNFLLFFLKFVFLSLIFMTKKVDLDFKEVKKMNNVVDFNYIMSCSFYFDAEKNKALKKLIAKALRKRTHY